MEGMTVAEDLRDCVRRCSVILQHVSLPGVLLDSKFAILYMNDEFLKITGFTQEELTNRDFADIFIPEEKRRKVKNTQLLIQSGIVEIQSYEESELLTKEGKTLTMGWNNSPILDNQGNLLGVSCIGENISMKVLLSTSNADTTTVDPLAHQISPIGSSIENYVIVRPLKAGDNGYVKLAAHKITKELVAIKVLRKDLMTPEEKERARREIEIMKLLTSLDNPYIAKLIHGEETETQFTLIVEYLSGGELLNYVKQQGGLSEKEAQRLFKQLICAMECCHSHNIIHRDIKLQNILLNATNDIKLIDFGLSNFTGKGVFRNTFCGTPLYAAPEILLGTKYEGPEVDVWSLGVVLYVMLATEFPFKTIGDVLKGTFKEPPNVSEECVDLLRKMLVTEKNDRATLSEVLSHPWISKDLSSLPPNDGKSIAEVVLVQDSHATSPQASTDSDSSDGSADMGTAKKRKLNPQEETLLV